MTSNQDRLTYLAKRPFWAILPARLDALYALLTGTPGEIAPINEGNKAEVAKVTGELYQSTAPMSGKTAVIPIIGSLSNDRDYAYWQSGTCYLDIQQGLDEALSDSQVSEILLLVDSPGGEVMGCPETADAIFAANKVKQVSAMVMGDAASAAYYLTSQASRITLTPSGEVGSVGVICVHTDITKMLDNAGVKVTPIYAGKYKTEWWPFTPMSEDAKAAAQASIDEMYQNFLGAVARGRGKRVTPEMAASNYGDGRMLNSREALASGLVDEVLTVKDALASRRDRNRMAVINAARKRELDLL